MTDLRKAAEELIKEWDWECGEHQNKALAELIEALRQALAMEKFSEVNQEIEEALKHPDHLHTADCAEAIRARSEK